MAVHVSWRRIFGGAAAVYGRGRRAAWVDLFLLAGAVGVAVALFDVGREWTGELRPAVEIDLSLGALPRYALLSLARGLVAYLISLGITLGFGYWAAKDRLAERVIVPLFDILQSVPVLAFMPGFVLALIVLFPRSNVGLELASVGMIVTGQAWNMFFSFYHSVRSVPPGLREAARAFGFSPWRQLTRLELPCSAMGLAWNSMLSMAGGWFFLIVCESFVLGDRDFRLPGLGAYMSVAVARGDVRAQLGAVGAMVALIVLLDQILWRPVVVWAQRFRLDESGRREELSSWFLDWMKRSALLEALRRLARKIRGGAGAARRLRSPRAPTRFAPSRAVASRALFVVVVLLLAWGTTRIVGQLRGLDGRAWLDLAGAGGATLARVLASSALGTLWALPAGLAIGLSPRVSRALQPVVQVLAAFPAPMLFPLVVAGLAALGVPLGAASVALMFLGTQWYILFNVIAGAMGVPAELREVAKSYHLPRMMRFRRVYLPAVFPYLVTGWVTATGGAWNASIVAEYVRTRGGIETTWGLGAFISRAAERADFSQLAAGVLVMASIVVLFNRIVWRRLYLVAENRFGATA